MQQIIINGVSYDSPDAMPPDVRRLYDQALRMMKDVQPVEKTVKIVPGGVSINAEQRQVRYNIDGKIYDDPAQLPPEIRAKVEQALAGAAELEVRAERPRDVQVVQVQTDIERGRIGCLVIWLLIGVATAPVLLFGL